MDSAEGSPEMTRVSSTIKILKSLTPEKFAVIIQKFEQCGFNMEECFQKRQTKWQILQTHLDPDQTAQEQSGPGHAKMCLMPLCNQQKCRSACASAISKVSRF